MLNKVMLIGRLGRDPEVRTLNTGTDLATFSLATDERWKDKDTGERKERTEWHKIAVWGPMTKTVEQYLSKGDLVYLEGQIQTRSWESDGETKYMTEIVLRGFNSKMVMLSGRSGSGSSTSTRDVSHDVNRDDDEIPF